MFGDLSSCACLFLCQVGSANGNLFWIPVGDTHKKAYIEEWLHVPDEMKEWVTELERPDVAPSASTPPVASSPLESVEAPLPLPNPRDQAIFTHPLPTCAVPERLKSPFTDCDLRSGYEDDVTTRNDFFTFWARIKPEDLLALHMVDAQRAAAEYREASERKSDTSSSVHQTDKRATGRSARQRRLSVYKWNPGHRRGDEDAFAKQIAGKWHIITLREASDYVDHDILTKRFCVSHFGGSAVLFNKDTFTKHGSIWISSIGWDSTTSRRT